ncbi:MAG: hypothetical protein AAF364_10945 [Pseudomonadota bacterium]|jgi:hypothetical protein
MDATYQNLSRLNTASRPSLVDYMNDSAGNTNALQAVVEKAKKADELQGSFNDFHAQLGTDKTAQLNPLGKSYQLSLKIKEFDKK